MRQTTSVASTPHLVPTGISPHSHSFLQSSLKTYINGFTLLFTVQCYASAVYAVIVFSFHPLNFDSSISHLQNALQHISSWMMANLLTKTEFLLIRLKNQLAKIQNSSLDTSHSARNLGFIFDEHLTFSDQITSLSKACYYQIRQLRCIWPYLDSSTACTIATSIVHSKLDYCNSLYYKLPKSQLSRLQQIQNCLARTVVKAPKSCHITSILRSPLAQNQ